MSKPTRDQNNLEEIILLLKENKLPYEDIITSGVEFITSQSDGSLIACIGIEKYGDEVLLRSFAVKDTFKNKGIGTALFNQCISQCKREKIKRIHLLTTTAEQYFIKKGFIICDRTDAPEGISKSSEFKELCPASAVYMVKDL